MKFISVLALLIVLVPGLAGNEKIRTEKFDLCMIPSDFSCHSSPSFSTDMREMIWSEYDENKKTMVIKYRRKTGGKWGQVTIAPFSGKYWDDNPCFLADRNRVFFSSKRPVKRGIEKKDLDIWYVDRKDGKWGSPVHLSFNTRINESGISVAASGNIYYTSYYRDTKGDMDIYRVKFENGKYGKPENVGSVNTKFSEFTPHVSPDERCFILSTYNRPEGNGLFIYAGDGKGNWSKPVYIDSFIDMKEFKRFPSITPDGKVLILSTQKGFYSLNFKELLNRIDS